MTDQDFTRLMHLIEKEGMGFMEAHAQVEREKSDRLQKQMKEDLRGQKPIDQNIRVLTDKWDGV